MAPPGLGDVVRRLPVGELIWDDLVAPDVVHTALQRLADRAIAGGLTVAVHGPAGVGKTFAIRVWAEAMRLDLWAVDSRLLVERHGERSADRGLDEVVPYAERPRGVLLFEHAGALFELAGAGAGEALLVRAASRLAPTVLETRGPVAPTWAPEDATVCLPAPDAAQRRLLWERLVARASPLSMPDVERLAATEAPGAAIDAAVRAVVLASGDERLETDALLAALEVGSRQ